jgi:hypothetical protein
MSDDLQNTRAAIEAVLERAIKAGDVITIVNCRRLLRNLRIHT